MIAVPLLDKHVIVREVLPQDLKVELEKVSRDEAGNLAGYLANVVGQAHARQLDREVRQEWLRAVQPTRPKSPDAPSWLWKSVVDLVAVHDIAYLEHCRHNAAQGDL
jgi:uncharacterized protein (DUF2252 family)